MPLRVWWREDFDGADDDEERLRIAWSPPKAYPWFGGEPHDIEDVETGAEMYADYFWSERDGYEDKWPQDFVVEKDGKYHLVTIDVDHSPSFNTNSVEDYKPNAEST